MENVFSFQRKFPVVNGRGGGLVVSVLAVYSGNPRSNPAGYLNVYMQRQKNEKEARVGPSFIKKVPSSCFL